MLLDLKLISMQSMQYALYHVFQKTHDKHLWHLNNAARSILLQEWRCATFFVLVSVLGLLATRHGHMHGKRHMAFVWRRIYEQRQPYGLMARWIWLSASLAFSLCSLLLGTYFHTSSRLRTLEDCPRMTNEKAFEGFHTLNKFIMTLSLLHIISLETQARVLYSMVLKTPDVS